MYPPPHMTCIHARLRPVHTEWTYVHLRDLPHVSSDFRVQSTSGTWNGAALFTNSTRGCLQSSVKGLAESLIFSKLHKSSRENAQGVEIFLTEPLFTPLLKNPLARRGAHQLPHPTSATKLGPVLPKSPFAPVGITEIVFLPNFRTRGLGAPLKQY